MAPKRPRLSERRKAVGSGLPLEAQSEVWLDRAEFQNLTRPQAAATIPAPRSASAGTDDLDTTPLGSGRSRVTLLGPHVSAEPGRPPGAAPSALFDPRARISVAATADSVSATADSSEPARPKPEVAQSIEPIRTAVAGRPAPATIRVRQAWPRWFKQYMTLSGVALAFAGWAAWVLYMVAPTEPIPTAATEASTFAAPRAGIPSPGAASRTIERAYREDPAGVVDMPPAASPKPAVAKAERAASEASEAHDPQSNTRMIIRHKPSASMPALPRGTPTTPEEAYQWSAAFSSRGEHWDPLRTGDIPSR